MTTSAQQDILQRLKDEYPSVYPSGELQRMDFKSKNGTNIAPRTIVRALQHLEEDSKIAVKYGNRNHSHYRYLQEHERDNYIPTAERTHPNQIWKNKEVVKQNKYKAEYQIIDGIAREVKVY